jgi:Zn finger protein HypA/HybF involved in hydrogenase expression
MKDAKFAEAILGTQKRKKVSHRARRKRLVQSKGKCKKCGEPLNGLKPPMHHKDENSKNNNLLNVDVLCPNCHSRTRSDKKHITNRPPVDVWGIKQPLL